VRGARNAIHTGSVQRRRDRNTRRRQNLLSVFRLHQRPTFVGSRTPLHKHTIRQAEFGHPRTSELHRIERADIVGHDIGNMVAFAFTTGRKKLIMAALWTEVCLVHPALDAIKEGFDSRSRAADPALDGERETTTAAIRPHR
jgi:hypothetical protein